VAQIIAGCDPPKELVSTLSIQASSLRNIICKDKDFPGRPELRRRLKEIAEAARLIEAEITDPVILGLLIPAERSRLLHEYELHAGLGDLIERAEAGFKLVPRKQGTNGAMDVCAHIVTAAWKAIRGKWPGQDNKQAKLSCETLWGAVGGDVAPRGGSSTRATWRDHLREAKKHRDGYKGKVLSRNYQKERKRSSRSDEERVSIRYGGGGSRGSKKRNHPF
jgi:hypothetical protein